jgi:hypothetical protein
MRKIFLLAFCSFYSCFILGSFSFIRVYYQKNNSGIKKIMFNNNYSIKIPAVFFPEKNSYYIDKNYFKHLQERAKKFVSNSSPIRIFGSPAHFPELVAQKHKVLPHENLYFTNIEQFIEMCKSIDVKEQDTYFSHSDCVVKINEEKRKTILSKDVRDFCDDYKYDFPLFVEKFNSQNLLYLRGDIIERMFAVKNLQELKKIADLVFSYIQQISCQFKTDKEISADQIIALLSISLLCSKNEDPLCTGLSIKSFLEQELRFGEFFSSQQIWSLTQIAASAQNIYNELQQ